MLQPLPLLPQRKQLRLPLLKLQPLRPLGECTPIFFYFYFIVFILFPFSFEDGYVKFVLSICCSGVAAASVTQHMTELSLSCEEKGASASTANRELTEPGGLPNMDHYIYQSHPRNNPSLAQNKYLSAK